jgi:hypothetical protein
MDSSSALVCLCFGFVPTGAKNSRTSVGFLSSASAPGRDYQVRPAGSASDETHETTSGLKPV